jgi:hypothetical protein
VSGPWTANVILLALTQPRRREPRKHISRDNTLPWALDWAGDSAALGSPGQLTPSPAAQQLRLSARLPLLGDIDRSEPLWRVFFQGREVDRPRAGRGGRGLVLRARQTAA